MPTEVLLMADVKDLGDEGDVVTVADGYARNYLLPKELAAPVTAATRRRLEKLRVEREAVRKAERQAAAELSNRLSQVSVTVAVKVSGESEEGKLYGSVTVADILVKLEAQGVKIDRDSIVLEHPIKELGVFDVEARLHEDIQTKFKVWVVEE